MPDDRVIAEWRYGPRLNHLAGLGALAALFALFAGFVGSHPGNDDRALLSYPLAIFFVGVAGVGVVRRWAFPQRIALTSTAILIPVGRFTQASLRVPLAHVQDVELIVVRGARAAGRYTVLRFSAKGRVHHLTELLLPSAAAFDQIVRHLRKDPTSGVASLDADWFSTPRS